MRSTMSDPRRGTVRQLRWALGAIGALTLVLVVVSVPASAPHNHWAAIAAVTGFGALLFAFLATWVAVMAYRRSTQTPELRILPPIYPPKVTSRDGKAAWRIDLTLVNNGLVAARFVAVRITISGAFFEISNRPWQGGKNLSIVQWDGGVDTIIHPGWDAHVPSLDAWLILDETADRLTATVEVVADRVRTITQTLTVPIMAPPPEQTPLARDDNPAIITARPL